MNKDEVKYGIILSYLLVAVNVISGLAFTPYLVHRLGNSQYGLYEIIVALASNLSILSFGMSDCVVKFVSTYRNNGDREKESEVIGCILKLLCVSALLAFFVCIIVYRKFDVVYAESLTPNEMADGKLLFIVSAINLVMSLPGSVFSCVLTAYEKFATTRMLNISRVVLRIVLIVLCLNISNSAMTVLVIDTLLNIALIVFNYFVMKVSLGCSVSLKTTDKGMYKTIFSFSAYTVFFLIAREVQWQTDKTIIGLRLNTEMVTIYAAGSKISAMFNQLGYTLSGLYLPRAISIEKNNPTEKKYRLFIVGMGRIVFPIIMIVYIGYFFLGLPFIELWMGEGYESAFYSSFIMMTSLLVPILLDSGIAITKAKDKQGVIAISWFLSSTINIVLTWIVVLRLGIIGASLMTLVTSYLINVFVLLCVLKRETGLKVLKTFIEIFRGYLLPLVMSVSYFILIYKIIKMEVDAWPEFFVVGFGYVLIYLFCIFTFYLSSEQRNYILSRIERRHIN